MVHSENQWETSLAGAQASGVALGAKTTTALKAGLPALANPRFLSREKSEVMRAHTWAKTEKEYRGVIMKIW